MLILDDYHSIHDLVIHKAMGFLLEALPHSVYLVLATRHDPPIALSRLRGRGQMTEIRQADLRFSQEEEAGRLDLILAHPISRRGLFWGRLAAFAAVSAAIAMLGWLGFALLLGGSSLGVSPWQMALPFLPVLAQTLIYGTLAVLLGALLPTRRLAAMVTGVVMMASYMASSLASLDDRMALVADYLPYEYFQGGEAIGGLDVVPFLALVGASAGLSLRAWWRFEQRDVRVGGEGSWQLPWSRKRPAITGEI